MSFGGKILFVSLVILVSACRPATRPVPKDAKSTAQATPTPTPPEDPKKVEQREKFVKKALEHIPGQDEKIVEEEIVEEVVEVAPTPAPAAPGSTQAPPPAPRIVVPPPTPPTAQQTVAPPLTAAAPEGPPAAVGSDTNTDIDPDNAKPTATPPQGGSDAWLNGVRLQEDTAPVKTPEVVAPTPQINKAGMTPEEKNKANDLLREVIKYVEARIKHKERMANDSNLTLIGLEKAETTANWALFGSQTSLHTAAAAGVAIAILATGGAAAPVIAKGGAATAITTATTAPAVATLVPATAQGVTALAPVGVTALAPYVPAAATIVIDIPVISATTTVLTAGTLSAGLKTALILGGLESVLALDSLHTLFDRKNSTFAFKEYLTTVDQIKNDADEIDCVVVEQSFDKETNVLHQPVISSLRLSGKKVKELKVTSVSALPDLIYGIVNQIDAQREKLRVETERRLAETELKWYDIGPRRAKKDLQYTRIMVENERAKLALSLAEVKLLKQSKENLLAIAKAFNQ